MGSTAEIHLYFTKERHTRWAMHVAEDMLKLQYAPADLSWVQEADSVCPLSRRYLLFREEAAKLDPQKDRDFCALNELRRNRTELVIGRCADLAGWASLTDGEELFPQLCCACVLRYPHVPFTGFYRYEMTVSGAVQLIRTCYDGRIMHVQVLSGMLPMDEDDWSRAPVRDYTVEDGVLAEA